MKSNPTLFALTSLVCGVVASTAFVFAQSRQTAPQSPSQLPQVQSDRAPKSEVAMPGEHGRETTQALITPDEFERRRDEGPPLRMPAEQIEAAKDGQSAAGE